MRPLLALPLSIALLGAACSSTTAPAAATVATYAGDSAIAPFPSNHFARADSATATGLRVDLRSALAASPMFRMHANVVDDLGALDGFSTAGGAFAQFSAEIDAAPIVARAPSDFASQDSPVAIVDVDPTSPDRGHALPLVASYWSSNDSGDGGDDFMLLAQPAEPLRPRTQYVFVVTDRVKDTSGRPVRPSDATRALVSGGAEGAYGDSVRAALPLVAQAIGASADHLAVVTLFTTATVQDETLSVASDARSAPPPASVAPPQLERHGDAGDKRVRFTGSFAAPEYRAPKPDGVWHSANGKPVKQADAALEYDLAFSDGTRSGPRPIVIFGHGMGGDKDVTWNVAALLADLDVAVIGIDAPEHGSRHDPPFPPGKTDMVVSTFSFFGANLDTKEIRVDVARDNFRQMASDQLELVRFLGTLSSLDVLPVGAPDGKPDLDTSTIVYLGQSFGAVLGSTALALAPEIRAACLNVGGDSLMMLVRDSQTFKFLIDAFKPLDTTRNDVARFFAIAQAVVDPGDPINYARFVARAPAPGVAGWRGTDVLLQEVKDDNIVPNSTAEALSRALGLTLVAPVVEPIAGVSSAPAPLAGNGANGVTCGVSQFDVADGETATHSGLLDTSEASKQYVEFFRSAVQGGRATIAAAYSDR